MTDPGMEAVLAELMAAPDQSATGKGDPLGFLTGAGWPKPCLRCGSRDHKDCYAVGADD
jgi:hypothetical protein